MTDIKNLSIAADNIRILTAAMVEKAKSGHPGGGMGGADFINVLYSKYLRYDPSDPLWVCRDRFFLDPGHMSPMLYSVLLLSGKFEVSDIQNFRQWGSCTPGHPEVCFERGIENTSGPLGQGHTMAVGAAIAGKFLTQKFGNWMDHKIYTFISDGGIQEEISQGAGRIAGNLGLSNLIMFYDANNIQLSTKVDEVSNEDIEQKYKAWDWNVITINGNDAAQIIEALDNANAETSRPTLIIGNTTMGRGCVKSDGSNFEGQVSTHGQPLSAAGVDVAKTIENLGGDPNDPFKIFEETKKLYAARREELIAEAGKRKAEQAEWAKKNPELAAKLELFFSGKLPNLDFSKIEQKPNQPTRAASAAVLGYLADNVENMIVSSADLSNSDKTDGFLKKTHPIVNGDFSGRFLNAGVSELTMACIMNGIVLHGGMYAACGTFFVFSDYMKPAYRMAALMRLPVKYVWSHDAFRVGEDGPTHQPIEQEMQVRLLEKIKNHAGKNSMLVLRPADVYETTEAWKMAMENTDTPTALILSRQNVNDLPGDRVAESKKAAKGAYIVKACEGTPDIVMVANGSEVSTLFDGAKLLEERKNLKIQIVSAISEGLFRTQSKEYQEEVIPSSAKKYALTAGIPCSMQGLVGVDGYVHGLDHFGYSAPFKVLDEKFGFNAESVYSDVCEFLNI
ncbi:MAG: transketolase [Paludibacteraceae bacterium]|jgi:transketolase|nr:transketolase [Bacteroidales bacterium]MEE1175441.1 transketolase [Paludibacteraceae bacterium]